MIPYLAPPVWSVGPFTIHAFGAAVSAALVLGYWLVLRRARKYGLDATRAGSVFVVILIAALISGLAGGRGRTVAGSAFAAGGGLALILCAWRQRSWALLDLIGGAVPLMNVVARTGCFLAHDHVGRQTASWLGVRFPGGTRFDLGLLYVLAAVGTTIVVEWISRTHYAQTGTVFGAMVALMAITRLVIVRFGTTIGAADEIFAGLMFVAGCQVVVARAKPRQPGAGLRARQVRG